VLRQYSSLIYYYPFQSVFFFFKKKKQAEKLKMATWRLSKGMEKWRHDFVACDFMIICYHGSYLDINLMNRNRTINSKVKVDLDRVFLTPFSIHLDKKFH